jgi:uncharacterized membrane protein
MNAGHLHIMINHFPVVGAFGATLLLIWAWYRRNDELERAALLVWVLVALSAVAAYVTGSFAEDVVDKIPGVSPATISSHDDAALFALIAAEIAGLWALASLWSSWRSKPLRNWRRAVQLLMALAVCATMGWVASLGGRILHPEARPGWASSRMDGRLGVGPVASGDSKGHQSG